MPPEGSPDFDVPDVSELLAAAMSMHELFTTYMRAGFTEDQALKLVIGIITAPRSE